MTPRYMANHNKTRLMLVFGFTLLIAFCFQWYRGRYEQTATAEASGRYAQDAAFYVGMRKVKPSEVKQVLPEAAAKPTLLVFSSRFCHDCQRLAPVLSKLTAQHPKVAFRKLDVNDDQSKAPAILRVFKPVSVPVMVFIAPGGEIQNVLYNYQTPQVLAEALNTLQSTSDALPSASKKISR